MAMYSTEADMGWSWTLKLRGPLSGKSCHQLIRGFGWPRKNVDELQSTGLLKSSDSLYWNF